MDRVELERLDREGLVLRAQAAGIKRARILTRPELVDELLRLDPNVDPEKLKRSRGFFGRARDLLNKVVERGLHLPDAAERLVSALGTQLPEIRRPEPQAIPTVTLAEIYAAQGHKQRAIETLRRVLDREPEHVAARSLLERLEAADYVPPPPPLPPEPEVEEQPPTPLVDGAERSGAPEAIDGFGGRKPPNKVDAEPSTEDPPVLAAENGLEPPASDACELEEADTIALPSGSPPPMSDVGEVEDAETVALTPRRMRGMPRAPALEAVEEVEEETVDLAPRTTSATAPRPSPDDEDVCIAMPLPTEGSMLVVWRLARPIQGMFVVRVIVVTPSWDGPRVETRDVEVSPTLSDGEHVLESLPRGAVVRVAVGTFDEGDFRPIAHSPAFERQNGRVVVWTLRGSRPASSGELGTPGIARAFEHAVGRSARVDASAG